MSSMRSIAILVSLVVLVAICRETTNVYLTGVIYCPGDKDWKWHITTWEHNSGTKSNNEGKPEAESGSGSDAIVHFKFSIKLKGTNMIDGHLGIAVKHTCTFNGESVEEYDQYEFRVPLSGKDYYLFSAKKLAW